MQQLFDPSLLLDWFRINGKSYPWGGNASPYRVWISEVMLQQTVITTVIPYFTRWMKQFPTLKSLARSGEDTVLRAWEGLGYYSRARNILKSAGIIMNQYRGRVPDVYHKLCRLPGIGDYTASAILSIAYNQPYVVLDANVVRIMQRRLAVPVAGTAEKKAMAEQLRAVIPPRNPGAFNEAMMQLGQLICRRQAPLCQPYTVCIRNIQTRP